MSLTYRHENARLDPDLASYSLVRSKPVDAAASGRRWQTKEAFHAVARHNGR